MPLSQRLPRWKDKMKPPEGATCKTYFATLVRDVKYENIQCEVRWTILLLARFAWKVQLGWYFAITRTVAKWHLSQKVSNQTWKQVRRGRSRRHRLEINKDIERQDQIEADRSIPPSPIILSGKVGLGRPCLWPGYLLWWSKGCVLETYMLLAQVRVHEHWWPL